MNNTEKKINLEAELLQRIKKNNSKVMLSCSVENADTLGKEIIQILNRNNHQVFFTCFWNDRNSLATPIIKKYQEPCEAEIDYLIAIKPDNDLVFKTNLEYLLNAIKPKDILIIGLVAKENFKQYFLPAIFDQFDCLYYEELQTDYKLTPDIVKERRLKNLP